MAVADRLETLEVKLAHLERSLEELSDVVIRQQQDLDRLQRSNRQLVEQLQALREASTEARDPQEIPPHY